MMCSNFQHVHAARLDSCASDASWTRSRATHRLGLYLDRDPCSSSHVFSGFAPVDDSRHVNDAQRRGHHAACGRESDHEARARAAAASSRRVSVLADAERRVEIEFRSEGASKFLFRSSFASRIFHYITDLNRFRARLTHSQIISVDVPAAHASSAASILALGHVPALDSAVWPSPKGIVKIFDIFSNSQSFAMPIFLQ